ncbi:MAG TPA: TM2 domain-containing protein, partial [Ktedonobacterales bacterium]|nr:TM2 domain-containing protein [Ktedonobacterales bacterium]
MSVDISQLTARLDSQRQEAVKQQYDERATSPTAAFLLCFFLGSAGAHRFYLREWRVAFAHLALFAAGVAALALGLPQTLPLTTKLASHPMGAALDALGVALLLAALIWEIIDLGRIDHQVYQRNLLLAEGIIAGTLLADHTVVDEALQRLGSTAQRTREQASVAAVPAPASAAAAITEAAPLAGAGIITANEVADARALANETSGVSTISYAEMSRFDVSADPDQARQASADAAREGDWTERVTSLESLPAVTPESAPTTVAETITRTHIEDGPRVTDSYEVDRVAGPSAAEAVGLGAAGLGAAALGAGLLAYEGGAGFDEPTQPDAAASLAPQSGAFDPTDAQPAPRAYAFDPTDGLAASADTAASGAAPEPTSAFSAYPADAYGFDDDDIGDITDASMPAVVPSAADIGLAHASPAYVQLPEEQ